MAEVSSIVGITFMVIGSLLVALGLLLCYTTKVRRKKEHQKEGHWVQGHWPWPLIKIPRQSYQIGHNDVKG